MPTAKTSKPDYEVPPSRNPKGERLSVRAGKTDGASVVVTLRKEAPER